MQSKSRKILSVLLTLLMMAGVIAVAPITASAAAPVGPSSTTSWDFWTVDTNGSGTYGSGSWSWVQSTKTLTLNNITHSTSADNALQLPDGATLVLVGANTITSTYSGSNTHTRGIAGGDNLTITGSGSLNLTGGTASSDYESFGLDTFYLTISGGATVTAAGGTGGNSYGISARGGLTISDSTVTATGNSSALYSSSYTVPNKYKYTVATNASGSSPTTGTSDGSFVVNNTHRYAKIESPTAAPTITGPTSLTLAQGYAATSTNAYTTTGIPAPTVTKTSGDPEITWNNATKKLDIAAGLAAGTYAASLRVTNGVSPDATLNFTLTVTAAVQPPKTIFSTRFEANIINWILFFLGFGFIWMWFA